MTYGTHQVQSQSDREPKKMFHRVNVDGDDPLLHCDPDDDDDSGRSAPPLNLDRFPPFFEWVVRRLEGRGCHMQTHRTKVLGIMQAHRYAA